MHFTGYRYLLAVIDAGTQGQDGCRPSFNVEGRGAGPIKYAIRTQPTKKPQES